MKLWQKLFTTTACLSLAVAGFPTLANATANPSSQEASSSTLTEGDYTIAQVGNESTCREVATRRSDLNVRQSPGGRIVGSLARGTTVVIESEIGDWIPITAPLDGYVSARYLKYCTDNPPGSTAANPGTTNTGANMSTNMSSSCRQISQRKVAPVRENPSSTSRIINTLQAGRQVTVENLGASGWVPVLEPIQGYVSAARLTYCD